MDGGAIKSCFYMLCIISAIAFVLACGVVTLIESFRDHDYCTKCGHELNLYEEIYCPKCGTYIDSVNTYDWWDKRKLEKQQYEKN
jgi:ribosomal protein L37E